MPSSDRPITGHVLIGDITGGFPLLYEFKPVVTYGHVQSHVISPIISFPSLDKQGRQLATHYDDGGRALYRLYILISGI
jgi:hypothetical protein